MEQVITMFHCSVNLTFTSTRAMGGASSTFAGVCPLLLCMGRNGVIISGAGQDIALVRTIPDVQQLPCPQQRVEFQCQIMVPSTGLTWTLPDGLNHQGPPASWTIEQSQESARPPPNWRTLKSPLPSATRKGSGTRRNEHCTGWRSLALSATTAWSLMEHLLLGTS